jgi:phytoene desaturase
LITGLIYKNPIERIMSRLGADNILENIERRLPGLGNLYMAGHWVMGGVPGVLFSGRHAVQLMCHDDGRKFVTTPA